MSEAGGTGRAQLVAVAAAVFLVVFKGGAAWLTSSLALGAAALDSAVDVVVSSASYFVVRRKSMPFPFGPWLALGTIVVVLASHPILHHYSLS